MRAQNEIHKILLSERKREERKISYQVGKIMSTSKISLDNISHLYVESKK